jgi:hypothetical protein
MQERTLGKGFLTGSIDETTTFDGADVRCRARGIPNTWRAWSAAVMTSRNRMET